MSIEIKDIGHMPQGIKTVIRKECAQSIAQLENGTEDAVHTTVHEVRKSCKKIRGVLRLVRDVLGDYHGENHFFRDQARKISDLRDATAIIEALDMSYAQYGDKLYKNAFSNLRDSLIAHRENKVAEVFAQKNILQEIKDHMVAKRNTIAAIEIQMDSYRDVAPSIARVYKRGRRAYQSVCDTQNPDDFHEWRKRVKYLRYHLQALQAAWPGIFLAWEDELHSLSDYLGTDRDLYMLQNHLMDHPEEDLQKTTYLATDLIKGQRNQLQGHALLLGARLYELKPHSFVAMVLTAMKTYIEGQQQHLWPKSQLES